MPPRELVFEALSAITGCEVKSVKDFKEKNPDKPEPNALSPQGFINEVLLPYLTLSNSLQELISGIGGINISKPETEAGKIRKDLFVNEEDFFDPAYDYDFTDIRDGQMEFKRGQETYKRPCGWNRIALKVLNKYLDGNGWLGTGPDAWPVSYHGTSIDGAKEIIKSHYKAGPREACGRGIYSTPKIETALIFSKTFTSKKTNKTYNVILQNRINPSKRQCFHDYWLVPVPAGTSAEAEKDIVESAIRPYGLLLREMKPGHNLSG